MAETLVSGPQAARILKVDYHRLYFWERSGLLACDVHQGVGHGSKRFYRFTTLLAARLILELRRRGVSGQRVRKAVAEIRRRGVKLESARLLVWGKDVLLVRSDREMLSILEKPGQHVAPALVIALSHEVSELRRRVRAELERAA